MAHDEINLRGGKTEQPKLEHTELPSTSLVPLQCKYEKKKKKLNILLTESAGSSDGDVEPGEAGGHPDGDHLHVAPTFPLLHQHPSRPHLPLDLPAVAAEVTVAAAAASAALRGAPPEQLLGVPELDHLHNVAQLARSCSNEKGGSGCGVVLNR
jgi:hypothetical protein